ncbi:hypothetical protein HZS_3060, partial [Henneguya salminicola]
MSSDANSLKNQLENHLSELQKFDKEVQDLLSSRQRLEVQLCENKLVQDELELLKSGSEVYRLTGPTLLRQELSEAKDNIQKRINFIGSELNRINKNTEELKNKRNVVHDRVMDLQQKYKQALNIG